MSGYECDHTPLLGKPVLKLHKSIFVSESIWCEEGGTT